MISSGLISKTNSAFFSVQSFVSHKTYKASMSCSRACWNLMFSTHNSFGLRLNPTLPQGIACLSTGERSGSAMTAIV